MRSRLEKLEKLQDQFLKKEAIEINKRNKEREEMDRRRGGWLQNREKSKNKFLSQTPEAFKPMRYNLKEEVIVKEEEIKAFDPSKANFAIQNLEIEEVYQQCIPDEELFGEDYTEYDEEDPLGYENCTLFTEIDSMIDKENRFYQNPYKSFPELDLFTVGEPLHTCSTDISESSHIVDTNDVFSKLSLKSIAKNIMQKKKFDRQKQRN